MIGHRPSSLPIARFCPVAPGLSSGYSGRNALMGLCYHAKCAGHNDDYRELCARLTEKERETVESWKSPETIVIGDVTLDYESAIKELAVGLTITGEHCDYNSAHAITAGTLDFGWVREVDGIRTAFVADLKKSRFTCTDGPDSLQVQAYAIAFASLHKCSQYCTGLWIAEDGEWQWSKDMIQTGLFGGRLDLILEAIVSAALNKGEEPVTGEHCSHCYGRLRCPAYAMPAHTADSWLSPLTGETELTNAVASELLLKLAAFEKIAEEAKEKLKVFAQLEGSIVAPDGSVWGPSRVKGRESLDTKALESSGVDLSMFRKTGRETVQFKWRKPKS